MVSPEKRSLLARSYGQLRLRGPLYVVVFAVLFCAWLAGCSPEAIGPNRAPVAVAGTDLEVRIPDDATLDATGSYDPDGDEITGYEWKVLAAPVGCGAKIDEPTDKVTSIEPDLPGIWLISLMVSDGELLSEPDVVRVLALGGPCEDDSDCPGGSECSPQRCEDGYCVTRPLENGTECGERSCDGKAWMMQTCQAGACTGAAVVEDCDDGDDCTIDDCLPESGCEHENAPAGTDCDVCGVGDDSGNCLDDLEQHEDCGPCQKCAAGHTCQNQADNEDLKDECLDSNPCMTGFCDGDGACGALAAETPCDDGVYCNGSDSCDGIGGCTNHTGNPCPETECNHCQEDGNSCFDPAGTHCGSGGAACLSEGTCDGAGNCSGASSDEYCVENSLGTRCLPACSAHDSGCMTPPDSMYLVCNGLVDLPGQSACVLTLAGGDTNEQESCLECMAEIGPTLVDYADFGDDVGHCDLDGWRLLPGMPDGMLCYDGVNDGGRCEDQGGSQECCDELDKICTTELGGFALFQDKVTNCGAKHEQWRMEKTVDLTGLKDTMVCFDLAHRFSSDRDGLIIFADNGVDTVDQVFCIQGGEGAGPDDFFSRICTDPLPQWTDNNSEVTIRFAVHSESDNHRIFIDKVSITGWGGGCEPIWIRPLIEDWNEPGECDRTGWVLTGDEPNCPGNQCSNESEAWPAMEADQTSFSLSTVVNASELDGNVTVCFVLGYSGTSSPDSIALSYDDGSGWQEAWRLQGYMGNDDECREFCVDLSDIDPGVNNNGDLGIKFDLDSSDGKVSLYSVDVWGLAFCQVENGEVMVSNPVGDGLGNYDFTAVVGTGSPLSAKIDCSWVPDEAPRVDTGIDFRNPFSDWLYRRKIVFDNGSQDEDLFDFPVLVRLHTSSFAYTHTQDEGQDIRFVEPDLHTVLPHEIERWDENGNSAVWVKVPHIPGDSTDDYIWMFYGNDNVSDSQDPCGVWDNHFQAVYHLAEENNYSGTYDSSWHDHDGGYVSDPTVRQNGGFGDWAVYFDGNDDRVQLSDWNVYAANVNNGITLEAFAYRIDDGGRLISKADGHQDGDHIWMLSTHDSGQQLRFRLRLGGTTHVMYGSTTDIPSGEWFYAVATYNGFRMRLYLDGVPDGFEEHGGVIATSNDQIWIGSNPYDDYDNFGGMIGEVRVSNIARTEGWIEAQHRNLTGNFVSVGSESEND